MKALESPLISSTAGGLAFLATWFFTLNSAAPSIRPAAPLASAHAAPRAEAPKGPVESWIYFNPEIDLLIKELKAEKEALVAREQDLNQLSIRLKTERKEIDLVADTVKSIQADIDKRVVEVKADELPNLKRLAKTYASMTPSGAAGILRELNDSAVIKVLTQMKEAETGPILEAMAKQGPSEAQRAAELIDRLRLAKLPPVKPKA